MKIDKEYPATHSMSTAWYCVDEDGNVGVFDIDDNGPVPVGGYRQNCVEDVLWEDFSFKEEQFRRLNLGKEQIMQMLKPVEIEDVWESEPYDRECNVSWMNVIIQIDTTKYDILKKALSFDNNPIYPLVCISEETGLYFVDFFDNKQGVELLEQNKVVKAKFSAPYYNYEEGETENAQKKIQRELRRFPFYIYRQDYSPEYEPAVRRTRPNNPMKIDQLPEAIKEKATRLPLKFEETEKIQLAEWIPVTIEITTRYVYDNKVWCQLASTHDDMIYYNEATNTILSEETMKRYMAEGKVEEWDYHKHHHLEAE